MENLAKGIYLLLHSPRHVEGASFHSASHKPGRVPVQRRPLPLVVNFLVHDVREAATFVHYGDPLLSGRKRGGDRRARGVGAGKGKKAIDIGCESISSEKIMDE